MRAEPKTIAALTWLVAALTLPLVPLLVAGCGGSAVTTTQATTTTLAPTTTSTVRATDADVAKARATLETDLSAFKSSLEQLRNLTPASTKEQFQAARVAVDDSWNAVKESATALAQTRGSQVKGAADQLQPAVDEVQGAWDGTTALIDGVQNGTLTILEAIAQVPKQLAALATAVENLGASVKSL